jgi:hypothetical protein
VNRKRKKRKRTRKNLKNSQGPFFFFRSDPYAPIKKDNKYFFVCLPGLQDRFHAGDDKYVKALACQSDELCSEYVRQDMIEYGLMKLTNDEKNQAAIDA